MAIPATGLRGGQAAAACVALALYPGRAWADDASTIGALSAGVATATAPDGSYLWEGSAGFELLLEHVEAAMHVDFSSGEIVGGTRNATSYVPSLGMHVEANMDRELIAQAFGRVRLPVQVRSGARLADTTGVALGAEGGGRAWACIPPSGSTDKGGDIFAGLCFGLSLSIRYQHHLSAYQMGSAVLPSGSSTLSVPFFFLIGFNPRVL